MMIGQRPNNHGRGPSPMGRGRESPNQGVAPCFKCGGLDHWAKDCPCDRPTMNWPRVKRFCLGCHINHLSKDCPNKPVPATTQGPSTSSINLVEIIPSPSTLGGDEIASLRVITRAQAQRDTLEESGRSPQSKPKRKRRKKKSSKSACSTSHADIFEGEKEHEALTPKSTNNEGSTSSSDKGGLVTIDRVDDPLLAMEGRIALKDKLPQKLAQYPCAMEEFANHQFHKKLIEHNQELLEGPRPKVIATLPPFKNSLEPINENQAMENVEDQQGLLPQIIPDFEKGSLPRISLELNQEESHEHNCIPPLDKEFATHLWEEVREKLKDKYEQDKPPLSSIAPSRECTNDNGKNWDSQSIWECETDQ